MVQSRHRTHRQAFSRVSRIRRARVAGRRRLHGPRQLGNGPSGRRAVPLWPTLDRGTRQRDGGGAADHLSPVGRRRAQGSCPGCREHYPAWTRIPNWLLSEIAIAGCDLAEVLGSAVALNLLFHIPLLWAVLITAADVLALLALQGFGMRLIEAVVLTLVTTIAFCFAIEIFALPRTGPDLGPVRGRTWPKSVSPLSTLRSGTPEC